MAAQRDKDKKRNTENPPKKVKKDPAVPAVAGDEDDDDDKEDLEEVWRKANVNGQRNHCTEHLQLRRDVPQ